MRINSKIIFVTFAILGHVSLFGQNHAMISLCNIPDSGKIARVSFSDLYDNFDSYVGKIVEFKGYINDYLENQFISPPGSVINYREKKLHYNFPNKYKCENFDLLGEKYSGYFATVTAKIVGLSSNYRMDIGKGYIVLQKVVIILR